MVDGTHKRMKTARRHILYRQNRSSAYPPTPELALYILRHRPVPNMGTTVPHIHQHTPQSINSRILAPSDIYLRVYIYACPYVPNTMVDRRLCEAQVHSAAATWTLAAPGLPQVQSSSRTQMWRNLCIAAMKYINRCRNKLLRNEKHDNGHL